jgi:hypothetical protein
MERVGEGIEHCVTKNLYPLLFKHPSNFEEDNKICESILIH